MTARKKYTKEFKLDAISLVVDQGYPDLKLPKTWGLTLKCWVDGSKNTKLLKETVSEAMGS